MCLDPSCTNKCKSCSSVTKACGACSDGYYFYPYFENCQLGTLSNCKTYLTEKICQTCNDGYRNIAGVCTACSGTNCKYCVHDIEYCTQCIEGYTFVLTFGYGNCSVFCSTGNCAQCRTNSSDCLICNDGYKLNSLYGCDAIGNNCKTMTSSICTACMDGYHLSGGSCYTCSTTGCKTCNENLLCTECQDTGTTTYYMDENFNCVAGGLVIVLALNGMFILNLLFFGF